MAACGERDELALHVVGFLVRDGAERASVRERIVRCRRVHVDAYDRVIANDKQAIAKRLQMRADCVGIERPARRRVGLDDELRAETGLCAVAVQLLARFEPGRIDGAEGGRRVVDRFAAQAAQHTVKENEEALRASIDDAGIFQHRQQFRRARDGLARALDGGRKDGVCALAVARGDRGCI